MSKKIYCAGPDVFDPEYPEIMRAIKEACARAGFVALCPADGELPSPPAGESMAKAIYEQNRMRIEEADAVMANVKNFRGFEPDSGTVFEIGYAKGLGKPVWCYNVPAIPLIDQVVGAARDGFAVEDFGLARNLMIAESTHQVVGNVFDCLVAMRDHYADIPSGTAQPVMRG